MKVTQRVKKILDNYDSDNPGTKANIARMLCTGRLGGTGKMVILPVDQGFEHGPARSFAPNPGRLRSVLSRPAGGRRRTERLRLGAGHDRGGGRRVRRPDPADPEGQQLEQPVARQGSAEPGDHRVGRRRRAPRLRRHRLHHLSRLGFGVRHAAGPARADRRGQGQGYRRGGLVLPAGRHAVEGRRTGDRRRRLCSAHGGADRRPRDQGQAADRLSRAGRSQEGLREGRHRHLDPGGPGQARRAGVLQRPAYRRLLRRRDEGCGRRLRRTPRTSTTAAATARSSAATPSSARASRRSRCSTRSSTSSLARFVRSRWPRPPSNAQVKRLFGVGG